MAMVTFPANAQPLTEARGDGQRQVAPAAPDIDDCERQLRRRRPLEDLAAERVEQAEHPDHLRPLPLADCRKYPSNMPKYRKRSAKFP